jgi:4-hydroxy-tetrahydrodipicolinate reductase
MKILIHGAMGRMGRAVIEEAQRQSDIRIAGLIESEQSALCGERLDLVLGSQYPPVKICAAWDDSFCEADVLIDFSRPEGAMRVLPHLVDSGIAMVCGTTGFTESEHERLIDASGNIALFYSPNMSPGMYAMSCALRIIAETLPPGWDIELIEAHHRTKKDSPSGTARELSRLISELRSPPAVHSLRIGDVPGRHSVLCAGTGEILEITHSVHSRATFASGSLMAARFVKGRNPGMYGMTDLLAKKRVKA